MLFYVSQGFARACRDGGGVGSFNDVSGDFSEEAVYSNLLKLACEIF